MSDPVSNKEFQIYVDSIIGLDPGLKGIYYFNTGQEMPIHVMFSDWSFDQPEARKKFQNVVVYGIGSAFCRFYVDDKIVGTATSEAIEAPTKPRRMALPRGTKGYTFRLEIVGFFRPLAIELEFDYLGGS